MLIYKKLWLTIGWVMIALVFYFSLTPSPPEIELGFEYLDKAEHFLAYFILVFWFAQIYKTHKTRLIYVMFFIAMGVLIEILQDMGKARFFEYSDMLANTTGVAFAWLLTTGKLNNLLLTFENKLLN